MKEDQKFDRLFPTKKLEPPATHELALLKHIRDVVIMRAAFMLDMYNKDLEDKDLEKRKLAKSIFYSYKSIFAAHCDKMFKDDIFWQKTKKENKFDA